MAIAIMGGLAVATILTLFFVPALYAAWFQVRRQEDEAASRSMQQTRAPIDGKAVPA